MKTQAYAILLLFICNHSSCPCCELKLPRSPDILGPFRIPSPNIFLPLAIMTVLQHSVASDVNGSGSVGKTSPIAIIGMSGKFPGEASNPTKLWDLCSQGRDAWTPIPSTRFNQEAFYHPDSTRNGSVSTALIFTLFSTDNSY